MKSSYYACLPSSQYITRKSRPVWLQSHASSIDPSRRTGKFVFGRKGAEVDSFVLTFLASDFLQLNNVLKQQNWKDVPNIPVQGWERENMLVPWRPRPHGQAWLLYTWTTNNDALAYIVSLPEEFSTLDSEPLVFMPHPWDYKGEIERAADIHKNFTPTGHIRDPGTQLHRAKLIMMGTCWLGDLHGLAWLNPLGG